MADGIGTYGREDKTEENGFIIALLGTSVSVLLVVVISLTTALQLAWPGLPLGFFCPFLPNKNLRSGRLGGVREHYYPGVVNISTVLRQEISDS